MSSRLQKALASLLAIAPAFVIACSAEAPPSIPAAQDGGEGGPTPAARDGSEKGPTGDGGGSCRGGSVCIRGDARLVTCANFREVVAGVPMGNAIPLSVIVLPANPDPPVSLDWSIASPGGGSLSSVISANPVFTCDGTVDQVHIDVTLRQSIDGRVVSACSTSFHLIFDCPRCLPSDGGWADVCAVESEPQTG